MTRDYAPFELYNLEDDSLNYVLGLSDEEKTGYFHTIISRFYADENLSAEMYKELQMAYRASFILEKVLRSNKAISESYRPVYTSSGLIRELVNNLYFTSNTVVLQ